MRRRLLAALLALFAAACATADDRTITVFAASSLTDALQAAAADFTHRTDVGVRLNLAGSQQLARQLLDGAVADLFISADPGFATEVADARGTADGPLPVATNVLVIVVEAGNPHGVGGLADLGGPSLRVALPAPAVPAGAYARRLLEQREVRVEADTLEPSVRATLSRVTLGEADAALVYASDAVAAGDAVETLPLADSPVATYPAVVLDDAPAPELARAFLEHLRAPGGQTTLVDHGLGPAPTTGAAS